MFYAHIVLAKKGPLARIWLAAHWDKKLTKAHVFETNIEQSVDGIMQPKVKLALRTSGHLLLGVVRIYSRKAKYLLADCNEAFVKIKMAFRPGMVDLPEGHREANVNAITLPEVFHDFDTALPELNDIDIEAQFSVNQSRADEITMREDYGSLSMSLHDDGFGDMGFDGDTPEIIRGGLDPNVDEQLFEKELGITETEPKSSNLRDFSGTDLSDSRLVDGDGFGDEFGQPELFEGDLFGEPPLAIDTDKDVTLQPHLEDSDEDGVDHFDTGVPSPMSSSSEYHPSTAPQEEKIPPVSKAYDHPKEPEDTEIEQLVDAADMGEAEKAAADQSTLIQNEDESFALAPIDASAYKGVTKSKRKRKLIVDEVKNISGEEMKAQLANTADIVTTLDLAPPTKRLMYWKETGGVEKLFSLPSRPIPAGALFLNYQRNLVSHISPLEDFSCLGPPDLLALDHIQPDTESTSVIQSKRGRKRKQEVQPQPQLTNVDDISTKSADVTSQSLAIPECVREVEAESAISRVSLNLGVSSDELIPPEATIFDSIRSPGPLFAAHEANGIEQIPSIADISMTPGHGMESHEELRGGLTPTELIHGHMTPHHATIETIESIPILPADQVSSILTEAENMPEYSAARPCEIATDWNDYDFPPSVGVHNVSDEQMENETDEQFEERVLNKRAAQMFFAVKNRINKQEFLLFSELTVRNSRKQAAQKFYSLLVLKKFRALNISQSAPYAEIIVSRGPMFENPKL